MFNFLPCCSLLILQTLLEYSSACPEPCSCKWKNGKQTVECHNKSLPEIPNQIDAGTQVLDFSDNNLQVLTNELFINKYLTNLQRIYLARCKIRTINNKTFKGLTNLVELDLSNNLIETVPTETFLDCTSLMRLTLSSNPIRTLKKLAFNHLSYLNTLELSSCDLFDVEDGAFQGLHSLEWLLLDGNKLKTMRGRRTLPENLKGVELQGNAWECDCHIEDLHAWLQDFSIPFTIEPTCLGPARLAKRVIKSIAAAELACLPDISPTTFYLELGEGKNVSLLCHVHAKPEALVSWWFQGQMLQNNTVVAPGVHLIYFVEEGSETKRSELFIYNANTEDNGTFICNAENAAGTSQSNFTIKIILKEEPIVIIVSFPFEYLLAVAICAVILGLMLVIVITILILKWRQKQRQRQQKTKEQESISKCQITSQEQQQHQDIVSLPDPLKFNNEDISSLYARDEVLMSPVVSTNQVSSGAATSLKHYQLEQNPDLINGTESITREIGDGEDRRNRQAAEINTQVNPIITMRGAQFPVACLRSNSREFYNNDVRWDVACVVDSEGYPIDYGLPKGPYRSTRNENYYVTLPSSNRMKRQSATNPTSRYSQEAEFLSKNSSQSVPYDHYHSDVRYTADGYPAKTDDALPTPTFIPSTTTPSSSSPPPPSTTTLYTIIDDVNAPASLPCCSMQSYTPPANLHVIDPKPSITRRCVSAQTDAQNLIGNTTINARNDPINDILTESPDEGYEGEPSVV